MRLLGLGCLVLIGCGRIAFDPRQGIDSNTADSDARGDASDAAASDLIAWYAFDEVSPSSVFVEKVAAHDAVCAPPICPQSATGHRGNAALFDGLDDCLSVVDTAAFLDVQALTVSVWVSHVLDENASVVAKVLDETGTRQDSWQLETGVGATLKLTTNHGPGGNLQISTGNALQLGVFEHYAMTWDGQREALYLGGVERVGAMRAQAMRFDPRPLLIGCDDNGSPQLHFTGAIDELQIYDRALSPAEIAALAAL